MGKRKAGSDSKRQFSELWENEFLFIATPSGKPMCIVCEAFSQITEVMILADTTRNTKLK